MEALDIHALRISLASPEQIRAWSYGEVTEPETINYLTHKPEVGGLFCERVFGPIQDWTCACKKYQRTRKAGFVCEKCGVELAPATVRRERMGHIELVSPVVHPWYVRGAGPIALLLNLSPRVLTTVLSYQCYLITSLNEDMRRQILSQDTEDSSESVLRSQFTEMKCGDILEESRYRTLSLLYGASFEAKTGADAIRSLLATLDLDVLSRQLLDEIKAGDAGQKRAIKRLHSVEAFRSSKLHPTWMVFSVLPVLPPELRPLVPLDGGRYVSSDINALYERVIHRNNRLKRFMERNAPEIVLNNERRLLQDACDALFDNAHKKRPMLGSQRQPLKSLTDHLQGKEGLFRRNLLGKRVDYSGRSVIVVGRDLLLHECGLPKGMACELFKPFIIHKLVERNYARTPRHAKRMVERRDPLIWDILAEVLFERVVLLNRAPTLHRLSIQAFQPRLVEGSAIQLHPLVCSSFNADFDGDQMAVHVPLTEIAQDEAYRLLLSTQNLRNAASGDPSVYPSQEIVLGCFYLTEDRPSNKQTGRIFANINEARLAYDAGHIDLHTYITVRIADTQIFNSAPPVQAHTPERGRIQTTMGRVIFNEVLPDLLRYRNYPMTKDALKALVTESLATCGEEATVRMVDEIKQVGYQYATKSGISFALSDIKIPPEREKYIAQGRLRVQEVDSGYRGGEITYEEWYRRVIEIWTEITDLISGKLKDVLDPYGTLMTIIKSGATKAKFQQIRQLSGIRGLMANPSGQIIPIPVLSNYFLGQLVWEEFIAASGARKGFGDRSLNTAMSGYLTRRLVEVGMEVWITQKDCGTSDGLLLSNRESRRLGLPNMHAQIAGRILAESIGDMEAGTILNRETADLLLKQGIECVRVRSPLFCRAAYGVCQHCYGIDLATNTLVRLGAAVGVIAGQSIGEPGTQLTMRTFHSGGIANAVGDITQGLPRVNELFEARAPKRSAILADISGVVRTIKKDTHTGKQSIHIVASTSQLDEYHLSQESQVFGQAKGDEERTYDILPGRTIIVREGQGVEVGTPLIEGPINPQEILHLQGEEATQRYLINEVQRVYRSTGVYIHDKHLETIVKQLLRYVMVVDAGDTELLVGTLLDRYTYMQRVALIVAQGGRPAHARPVLLGLTKAVLQTESWIAAASFQDLTRVLVQAAIRCQQDNLVGLKERLVIGRKMPILL